MFRATDNLLARHRMASPRTLTGFTLVELMIVLVIAVVILTIGIPSYQTMSERSVIKLATNELVDAFSFAGSQSMLSGPGNDISIIFNSASPSQWCYGISNQTNCDCNVSDPNDSVACTIETSGTRQLKVISSSDYDKEIAMNTTDFLASNATFSSVRRLVQPGDIILNSTSYSTRVSLNAMGLVHAGSDRGLGYLSCD